MPYRRLKAGFSVFLCFYVFLWLCSTSVRLFLFVPERVLTKTEWNAQGVNVCFSKSLFTFIWFCFSSPENYFELRTTNVKGKTDHSVSWGGIKSSEHFQRGEYFSDCPFDLFVSWFRLLLPGWIKTRLYSVISKYFFTRQDLVIGRVFLIFNHYEPQRSGS